MNNIFIQTKDGIVEILRGLTTVYKHVFRPPITLEYPEKKPELNSRYRGSLALLVNHDGSDVCAGCKSCMKVCPCGDLIQVSTSKNEDNKLVVDNFTIDIGRCIFCGNCTEVCPKKALIMTNKFELADFSRESLVLDKKKLCLSPEQSEKWRELLDKDV
jgi:NADH-quinone oxidoreductase subunit I